MPQFKHFPLPDVGEGLTEAEILGWRVQPGDTVTVNQIIVEIETAKSAVELPCPFAGKVSEVLAEPGQTVEVGAPIIAVDVDPDGAAPAETPSGAEPAAESAPAEAGDSEEVAALVGYGPRASGSKRRPRKKEAAGTSASAAQQAVQGAVQPTGAVPQPPAGGGATAPAQPGAVQNGTVQNGTVQNGTVQNGTVPTEVQPGGHVPLTKPPVRKLAKDLGVDLHVLTGSGADGVITREDVERAASGPSTSAPAPQVSVSDRAAREHRVPIKGVRKATAQAMVDSAFTAPHVTEFLTVDVTPMMELRDKLKAHPQFRDTKVTPLTFAARAVCLAARRTPDVNAAWDEQAQEIVYKDYVNLGIAAATPRGLVVPKVFDADQLSLRELALAVEQLTATAREGRTPPNDMQGGTFTITNVGVFGVDTGTPILNPGESAILALGSIRDTPWVVDGQVVPRKVCQLALSFDHRVIDGQQGSQFLADVGAIMADPAMAITF